MARGWARLLAEVAGAVLVAWALLAIYLAVAAPVAGGLTAAIAEAARRLFLFMDIGLGLWVLLLVLAAVRARGRGPGIRATLLSAAIGAVANLVTVIVVGLLQQGEWPAEFVGYAVQGGVCFLVAVALVVPAAHRLLPPPAPAIGPPTSRP